MNYCHQVDMKSLIMEITALFTELKENMVKSCHTEFRPERLFPYLDQICPKSALGANFCQQSVSKPLRFTKFDCHFLNQLGLKFSEHIYFDM